MNILISAYACEPGKGSEPEAGWKWARELSKRDNNIFVITRLNNKKNIENYITQSNTKCKINFIYHDLPKFFIYLKKFFKFTRIYYIIWQFSILEKCNKLNLKYKFDLVHHITFCSIRHFSLLSELNLKTFIGPLGGSETSPFWLRRHIGFKGAISETIRDIFNLITFLDPFFLRAIKKCNKIIFTTKSGIKYCPMKYRQKIQISTVIGLDKDEFNNKKVSIKNQKKILFVGRHLHWKGMKIGIEAFKKSLEIDPDLSLTIVGSGSANRYWKKLVNKYKISKSVEWIPWVNRKEIDEIFSRNGIFIFPSLHDSGGFAVLEAMKHGLPVICFDLGGPGETVNSASGIIIKTSCKDYKILIENFSKAINHLTTNKESWKFLSRGAQKRSKDFLISKVVDKLY